MLAASVFVASKAPPPPPWNRPRTPLLQERLRRNPPLPRKTHNSQIPAHPPPAPLSDARDGIPRHRRTEEDHSLPLPSGHRHGPASTLHHHWAIATARAAPPTTASTTSNWAPRTCTVACPAWRRGGHRLLLPRRRGHTPVHPTVSPGSLPRLPWNASTRSRATSTQHRTRWPRSANAGLQSGQRVDYSERLRHAASESPCRPSC